MVFLEDEKRRGGDVVLGRFVLAPHQTAAVGSLRSRLQQLRILRAQDHRDELTLLRFLKARGFNVAKAQAMYVEMVRWRQQVGADQMKEEKLTQQLYPRFYHKTDKLGRPVYIERLGKLRLEELLKVTTVDRMVLDHIKQWEIFADIRLPACSRKAGKRITQSVAIFDLSGVAVRHMSKPMKQFLKRCQTIDQDYYPEYLGKMFIVNAPVYFKTTWSIVKAGLAKQTRRKITVCGSDYAPQLLEWIDSSNLPYFLGGSCHCETAGGCESSNAGPWNE